jgi:hypothetical protein
MLRAAGDSRTSAPRGAKRGPPAAHLRNIVHGELGIRHTRNTQFTTAACKPKMVGIDGMKLPRIHWPFALQVSG